MTATRTTPPRVLTIAGSDSGGGAGVQADLKTCMAFGVHASCALTAVLAQNTLELRATQVVCREVVAAQIRAVFEDIGVDAVKIGMLATGELVVAVAETLAEYPPLPIVLDPVLEAKSGDRLLAEEATAALLEHLMPRVTLVTPNLPETEVLTGLPVDTGRERLAAAQQLSRIASAALIKGGHGEGGEIVDLLYDGERAHRFVHDRIDTRATRGTGCTLSAAIAAGLAAGLPLVEAVAGAEDYLQGALLHAFSLGKGNGPPNHFYVLTRGRS